MGLGRIVGFVIFSMTEKEGEKKTEADFIMEFNVHCKFIKNQSYIPTSPKKKEWLRTPNLMCSVWFR